MSHSLNRPYLPAIDQLRAFAALLVIAYHGLCLIGSPLIWGVKFDETQHWLYSANPLLAALQEGGSAVTLFIVLSGFILTLGTIGREFSPPHFFAARALRLYPMMIACIAASALIAPVTWQSALATLAPVTVPGQIQNPLTAMFWAVRVELQCYVLLPLLLLLRARFLVACIAAMMALRFAIVLRYGVLADPRDLACMTIFGRFDEFAIGVMAARLYAARGAPQPAWFAAAAGAVLAMLWGMNALGGGPSHALWKLALPPLEGAVWACFLLTYLSAARALPALVARALSKLGEVSYSLYLIHFAIMVEVVRHGLFLRLTGDGVADALLTTGFVVLPVSLGLAAITYPLIERPFLRLRPRYLDRPALARLAPSSLGSAP